MATTSTYWHRRSGCRLVRSLAAAAGHDHRNRGPEREFNVAYERVARESAEHWNLPDAQHTRGLRMEPEAYERRVSAFFDEALH